MGNQLSYDKKNNNKLIPYLPRKEYSGMNFKILPFI